MAFSESDEPLVLEITSTLAVVVVVPVVVVVVVVVVLVVVVVVSSHVKFDGVNTPTSTCCCLVTNPLFLSLTPAT